ncbi:probable pterin-4-alpha-carbinolamine dehydratase, chloroplastic [Impatiens glandulifera]|uniref:probable pterin-4-alpha-carbinolamine dehydratase, chloroplastic n=1 Tax=Impatiens glandulifera TaxID=253017 RepID=UPI001FB1883F|nr:probable pterin-4-alpha-carbinolamine dehydratase, chloroplastic [Impatiens glandulifera]
MATSISPQCFCRPLPLNFLSVQSTSSPPPPSKLSIPYSTHRRRSLKIRAGGDHDMLGDFGARDPFPAEIASNFGDKVLGNVSTEHKILIPTINALSLSEQDCVPISPSQAPLSIDEVKPLLRKVIGWRMLDDGGALKLQCLWKLKDFESGVELINRINNVVGATGHSPPELHLEQPNQVRAELWTASIGGLSINDFIIAAKVDQVQISDLLPRKRAWA